MSPGGCYHKDPPEYGFRIAQWISEDFGVKVISMWIDKLKANDPVMSADYTSLEHLVPTFNLQIKPMYARDWHSIQMVPCVSSDAGD
jgi:hypothetical protein